VDLLTKKKVNQINQGFIERMPPLFSGEHKCTMRTHDVTHLIRHCCSWLIETELIVLTWLIIRTQLKLSLGKGRVQGLGSPLRELFIHIVWMRNLCAIC
jgi:hypothetical protein